MKDEKMYMCLRWDNTFWACLILMNVTILTSVPVWLKALGILLWGGSAALAYYARRMLEKERS